MHLLFRISFRFAAYFILVQIVLVTLYHLLIVAGIIPMNQAWGGRLASREQMLLMESLSLMVNALLFWLVAQRANIMNSRLSGQTQVILLRVMAVVFLLNTFGNAMAIQAFERFVFTPLTFMSFICCLRLAMPTQKP